MNPTECFVLTREINSYDQDGEYFVAVFDSPPTVTQLAKVLECEGATNVMEALKFCLHVQGGGGRRGTEREWYNLNKVKYGEREQ